MEGKQGSKYNGGISLNGSTIGSLTNQAGKVITGGNGIALKSSTIENFTNNGSIIGTINDGERAGIFADNNSIIKTFTNNGSISGHQKGINFYQAHVTDFTNNGNITGQNSDGFLSNWGTINNFTNTGTIAGAGNNGSAVEALGVNFNTFKNSGTLKSDNEGGFHIGFFGELSSNGTLVSNERNGYIEALNGTGIKIRGGASIKTINNEGNIKANDGIMLYDVGWGGGSWNPVNISTLKNSGTILAKNDGIAFISKKGPNQNGGAMTIENLNSSGTILAGRYGIKHK